MINLQNPSIYLSSPRNFNDPFDSYVCAEIETFIKLYLLKILKQKGYVSAKKKENNITEKEYWDIYYSLSKEDSKLNLNYPNRTSFYSTLFNICASKSDKFNKILTKIRLDAQNEYSRKIYDIRNIQYKICCFSNFKDENELLENSTMWSHYVDNHRGFCVKYKPDFEILKNKEEILCGLFPITYTSSIPKISERELIKLNYNNGKLVLNKPVLKTTLKTLTTKSKFWNYEKEWRLIIGEQYSECILNNTISFLPVEAIYLGCRIEANLKKNLILFSENTGIKIYQTKQSEEKFNLNAIPQNIKTLKDDNFFLN